MECPFCNLPDGRIEREDEYAVVVRDACPVSKEHSLIIPRRHVGSFFETDDDERDSLIALIEEQNRVLDVVLKPDGYNIGINDGAAAGQTVAHLHVHLIPRFVGDLEDPRGGIRRVIHDKAKYWGKS